MLTEQRYEIILQLLADKKSVTVTELKEVLDTSESTIRRDLTALHRSGRLTKVFGGAVANDYSSTNYTTVEPTMDQKKDENQEEKRAIAQYATSLIEDDDFVYLDAGTTTGYMIDCLDGTKATFVTNAVAHAQALARKGIRVIQIGGEVKGATEAVIGNQAMLMLKTYHFTKGFFGVNGITVKTGMTTPDDNEAAIKRVAALHCREMFVLADGTKFGQISSVGFADFDDAMIITDRQIAGYDNYDNIVCCNIEKRK